MRPAGLFLAGGCQVPAASSGDLAGLKDVDRLGELPGTPRAAAEFAQYVPGLELGVGPLTGSAQGAWARLAAFCEGSLFRPL